MNVSMVWLSAACLALTACTASPAGDDSRADDGKDPVETQVLHYSSQDLAALPPGELLQFDVSDPNTVYAFDYSDPSELDHVMVHDGSQQYILGDQFTGTDKVADGRKHQALISADTLAKPNIVSCSCPCSIMLNGGIVICC